MDHRLQYYRGRGAARLSLALASYIFATTILITSAVVLVPAAFIFSARELAARVLAVLRRAGSTQPDASETLLHGHCFGSRSESELTHEEHQIKGQREHEEETSRHSVGSRKGWQPCRSRDRQIRDSLVLEVRS